MENNNITPEKRAETKLRMEKIRLAKMRVELLATAVFFIFIAVMGILFFVLPKNDTSEREKRKLTEFPELSARTVWDGSFTSGLNLYYSDNFAFRDNLVDAKYALGDLKGLKFDGITVIDSQSSGEASQVAVSENKEPPFSYNLTKLLNLKSVRLDDVSEKIDLDNLVIPTVPEFSGDTVTNGELDGLLNIDKSELEGEKRGSLYVIGDTALEIFYGSESVSKKYAAVINEYAETLGGGVTVYNMIVPNHFEFGLPQKYKGTVGRDEKPFIDIVRDNLDDSVVFVDIYSRLKECYEAGEYLYFRTDHHWTGLGAYRAYEKFCEYAGIKPVSLDSCEKRTSYGFLGTFYSSSMNRELAENPDYVEYYVTDLPYTQTNTAKDGKTTSKGKLFSEYSSGKTNGYLTFMGGDIPLATINTENKNGKKIIVFKESYGNAFAPYLVPHYETVYVADIRSFPYNAVDFIRENGVTDVLFLNNIMASNTEARVANIYLLKEAK